VEGRETVKLLQAAQRSIYDEDANKDLLYHQKYFCTL